MIVPSFTSLAFENTTLTGWIRFAASSGASYQTLFTRQYEDTMFDDFILAVEPTLDALGAVAGASMGTPAFIGPTLAAETWHQLAYAYDGSTALWIVDGQIVEQEPASGLPAASTRPMFIGCGRNGTGLPVDEADSDYVDGVLDELRIESVARSPAWLLYDYRAQRDQVISYE